MELADAKKAWILSNGDPITIIRSGGNVADTARIIAMKRRTGFYSINYLRDGIFTATSTIKRGDLIQSGTTGEQFFVEGYQAKTRGGTLISIDTELLMVNYSSVQVSRESTTYDTSGNPTGTGWTTIANIPMNVEHKSGNTPYKDGLLLQSTVFVLTMQTTVSLLLEDRITIDGKPYRVTDINLSLVPNLQVAQVEVDMR